VTAATATTALVIMFGLAWLAALVYRHRTTTKAAIPAEPEHIGPAPTIYDLTAADLGHPDTLDLDPPPCPEWPTWQTLTGADHRAAITAQLSNEH
jgi:hypothetical protein